MLGSLMCRLNLRHEWRTERTEDGGRFKRCRRCGKDWQGPDATSATGSPMGL
jgi:hypothetical protein